MKTRILSFCLVILLLSCVALCSSHKKLIRKCVTHCMKERSQTQAHCEMYCEGGHDPKSPYKHLTILEDGVPITESKRFNEMSDDVLKMNPGVRFDKTLFNTPSAFDELVKWSDVLKQQVAVSSEKVFNTNDGTQFHLLPMPIPLSSEQLTSKEFMNRLIDVVPASSMVFKEASPLTFTEAYRQFLLDIKIDQKYLKDVTKSPEAEATIKKMEAAIQNDMNQFLAMGDKCYAEYEAHLVAKRLTRITYTFDKYAATNAACRSADQHMINHETHSKELAAYLASLNPFDELFRAIGNQTQHQPDWNFNKEAIDKFKQDHVDRENAKSKMPSKFQVLVDMVKYYLNKDYFGDVVQMEESCLAMHMDFSALGWKDIPVTPHHWFNLGTLEKYKNHAKNSNRNYFSNTGILQRQVATLVIGYKPALKFVVTKAMKDSFIKQSTKRNFRSVELGPYLFTKAEFTKRSGTGMIDTYEMVLSASTADPQVIGFKTRSFNSLTVPRVSTDQMKFCTRQSACRVDKIPMVAIHRYAGNDRHFYTNNPNELNGKSGWRYEGIQGYCNPTKVAGTAPLYRYYHSGAGRHFYTANYNELGEGRDGWKKESIVCYVHTSAAAGLTKPWYRRVHSSGDHLYTTNAHEVQTHTKAPKTGGFLGMFKKKKPYWRDEGIACHLLTKSTVDNAIACCKCQ